MPLKINMANSSNTSFSNIIFGVLLSTACIILMPLLNCEVWISIVMTSVWLLSLSSAIIFSIARLRRWRFKNYSELLGGVFMIVLAATILIARLSIFIKWYTAVLY